MVSSLNTLKIVKKRRKTFQRHYSDRLKRLDKGSWRCPKGASLTANSMQREFSTANTKQCNTNTGDEERRWIGMERAQMQCAAAA